MPRRVLLINPALPPRQVEHPANYLDSVIAAERALVDKEIFERFIWPRYRSFGIEKTFHHYAQQTASLGLLSLAAVLRLEGHDAAYVQVADDLHDIGDIVEAAAAYDIVGATAICSTIAQSLQILARIKAAHPAVTTVLGGPHATPLAWHEIGDMRGVDIVVRGEGEEVLQRIADDSSPEGLSRLPGVDFHGRSGSDGARRINELTATELQALPPPAFDLVTELDRTQIYIQFSRGCSHRCFFCSEGARPRSFSMRQIVEVLSALESVRKHNLVFVVDSTFISNEQFIGDVCAAVRAANPTNFFSVQTRIDTVGLPVLRRLYEAHVINYSFGVENTSQQVLRTANKRLGWDDIVRGFTAARTFFVEEHGYEVPPYRANFIQGMPGELAEARQENLARRCYLLESGLVLNMNDSVFQPTPGSVFWKRASKYALSLPAVYRPSLRGALPEYCFTIPGMSALSVYLHHLEMRECVNESLIGRFDLQSVRAATATALTNGSAPSPVPQYVKC